MGRRTQSTRTPTITQAIERTETAVPATKTPLPTNTALATSSARLNQLTKEVKQ